LFAGDLDSAEANRSPGADRERERNLQTADQLEKAIAGNRGHNQAVGYFGGVLLPPLVLAFKPDSDAKTTLDQLQSQRDRLDRLIKARNC
jgi:hypothetical protein